MAKGKPKTEAERKKTHKARTGEETPPPRGTRQQAQKQKQQQPSPDEMLGQIQQVFLQMVEERIVPEEGVKHARAVVENIQALREILRGEQPQEAPPAEESPQQPQQPKPRQRMR